MKTKKIYLLSETDKWYEDYDPKEAFMSKEWAKRRLVELNGTDKITTQIIFYVMDEIPLMDVNEEQE